MTSMKSDQNPSSTVFYNVSCRPPAANHAQHHHGPNDIMGLLEILKSNIILSCMLVFVPIGMVAEKNHWSRRAWQRWQLLPKFAGAENMLILAVNDLAVHGALLLYIGSKSIL